MKARHWPVYTRRWSRSGEAARESERAVSGFRIAAHWQSRGPGPGTLAAEAALWDCCLAAVSLTCCAGRVAQPGRLPTARSWRSSA